jgi:hypothetical protein
LKLLLIAARGWETSVHPRPMRAQSRVICEIPTFEAFLIWTTRSDPSFLLSNQESKRYDFEWRLW